MLPSRSGIRNLEALALISAALASAIIAGLVVATNSPIAIGLVVGLIAGAVLFAKPELAVWLLLVGGLIVNGMIYLFFPKLIKLPWLFSVVGFLLLALSIVTLIVRPAVRRGLPVFIWIALVFVAYSIVTSVLHQSALGEFLAGFKRYFQTWGLMLALAVLAFNAKTVRGWLYFAFGVACLQLPFALYQKIVLVPARTGAGSGVVAVDVVAGTFESSIAGGGASSVMVSFLIVAVGALLVARREGLITKLTFFVLALLCAAPLALGETKIVLVLLPLMLLIVFGRHLRRNPISSIFAIGLGVGLTGLLGWLYLTMLASGTLSLEERIERVIAYNFGEVGYHHAFGLNRKTVLMFWWREHGLHNPLEFFFGHGLGSSYFGTGTLVAGHLFERYSYLVIGMTAMATLLWDTGLIGTVMFVTILISAWFLARRLTRTVEQQQLRVELTAIQLTIGILGVLLLFSDSMLALLSLETIMAFALGRLAMIAKSAHLAQGTPVVIGDRRRHEMRTSYLGSRRAS